MRFRLALRITGAHLFRNKFLYKMYLLSETIGTQNFNVLPFEA
jgi:hypothetical protein